MSVSVLIVTHVRVGRDLLDTVVGMLDTLPLKTDVMEVRRVEDPDALVRSGHRLVEKLNTGDGVLILTDAYGSTPSNIANRIAKGENCRVVSGVNLPMLINVYNFPKMSLNEMTKAAMQGGRDGIVVCD